MKNITVSEDYKILIKRLGEAVSEERRRQGLSQRELAKIANKSQAVIAKIEKSPPIDISLRSIYELTKTLSINLSQVVLEAEKEIELNTIRHEPMKVGRRLSLMIEKMQNLGPEDQEWLANMIETLITRTNISANRTDRTDNRSEHLASQTT